MKLSHGGILALSDRIACSVVKSSHQVVIRHLVVNKDVDIYALMELQVLLTGLDELRAFQSELRISPRILRIGAIVLQEKPVCIQILLARLEELPVLRSEEHDIRVVIPRDAPPWRTAPRSVPPSSEYSMPFFRQTLSTSRISSRRVNWNLRSSSPCSIIMYLYSHP